MKWVMVVIALAAPATLVLSGCAQPPVKSEVVSAKGQTLRPGDTVVLFHSGTEEVRKIICVGETIPVYREVYVKGLTKRTEVGQIKVLEYAGEHRFKGQVVEGKVQSGDIALKDDAACMVYRDDSQ